MSDARELPIESGDEQSDETSAELRALYERLQPPPLADDVSEADAETARVVGWMQGAWRTLQPSNVSVPRGLYRRRRARFVRRVLVAAAAVLVVLGAAALWRARAKPEHEQPVRIAQGPVNEAPHEREGAPQVEPTHDVGEQHVEVLALTPDHVELRSGPVRLVLLAPSNPPANTAETDTPTGG